MAGQGALGTMDTYPPLSLSPEEPALERVELPALTPISYVAPRFIGAPERLQESIENNVSRRHSHGKPALACLHDAFYVYPPGVLMDSNGEGLPQFHQPNTIIPEATLRILLPKCLRRIEEPVYVFNRLGPYNYYHWMVEMLPWVNQAHDHLPGGNLVSTLLINPSHAHLDFLTYLREQEMLSSTVSIVRAPEAVVLSLRKVWFPDFPLSHAMTPVARGFLATLGERARGGTSPTRKLFSRRGTSRVENEDLLCALMLQYGFEIVDNTQLTIAQQIKLYAHASVVAGVHGANLANSVFMPSGSQLIEYIPSRRADVSFIEISSALGFEHTVVVQNSDDSVIRIDEELIENASAALA